MNGQVWRDVKAAGRVLDADVLRHDPERISGSGRVGINIGQRESNPRSQFQPITRRWNRRRLMMSGFIPSSLSAEPGMESESILTHLIPSRLSSWWILVRSEELCREEFVGELLYRHQPEDVWFYFTRASRSCRVLERWGEPGMPCRQLCWVSTRTRWRM